MIDAYRVADVIAAEHAHAVELDSGILMERASTGLATAILRLFAGSVPGTRVVIAAGSGNNGARRTLTVISNLMARNRPPVNVASWPIAVLRQN